VYVRREGSNSFGDAVRTAINYAKGKHLIFMDADGSHSPEFIPVMYRFTDEYDVVIASRYIEGGGTDNVRILVGMSLILNLIYSLVLNLKCKDVSNSFKIYRTSLLRELTLRCNNFDIVEEILCKIVRKHKKVRIKEVPFTFKQRMFGHTKRNLLLFIFTFIVTIIKLRFGR
jgi:dolichol-phosphate mannosyltransferase